MNGCRVSATVGRALQRGEAVVALETAVLTHGLPPEVRWDTYREMLAAVERGGAVAAPVALLEGVVRVGATEAQLRQLCDDPAVGKAGLSDLPARVACGGSAGTTVATTLWAAQACGIAVFATGGIGGVHREVERTLDISGDLAALARYPGCVVCSGAKVVLDLPKTVEALQSLGVCSVGYRTAVFPAFVCADSGLTTAHTASDPAAVAEVVRARDALGLPAAVLVLNPPPSSVALDRLELKEILRQACTAAAARGVVGAALTPFLLQRLAQATAGASLAANRALLVANAELAARVAVALRGAGPLDLSSDGRVS